MKKTLLLAFSLILVLTLAFGLSSCGNKDKGDGNTVTYELVSTDDFVGVVEYEGTLDTTGLYLVPAEGERVPVTADMIGAVDTLSTGEKEHTFSYNDQSFTVKYVVKFSVTYIINGVAEKQLVLDSDEVVIPNAPNVTGKQFEGWSRDLPAHLTSNIVIEAIYQTLSSSQDDIYTWLGAGVIDLTGYAPAGATFEVLVLDEFEDEDDSLADVTVDAANAKINYSLNGNDPVIISLKAYEGDALVAEKSWYIEKVAKPELTIGDKSGIVGITVADRNAMQRVNNNSDITFKYLMTYSNGNVEINEAGDMLYITPVKAGVTNVTIKAVNAMNALESIDLEYCVVVKPRVFSITELASEFGIENIWTIGGINGESLPALGLTYQDAGEEFIQNITWVTDNADVSVNNGVITLATTNKAAELVNVVARFSYGGITLDSQPMTIRCVYNGINVFNYNDLYTETLKSDPRPIVLQASIKEDFSASNYTEMHTTYEDGYYANADILDQAKVKVLLQFRSDVYGNGHEINAHNATIGTHGEAIGVLTDASIFRGPLNLIAFSDSGKGSSISAKAQDNICFAAYEGVTLNNLVLKSCDLTPNEEGKIELNDLDYAGTTVEVLGDNVTIEYCRITNGRNVVRAFGDETDETKVIHVTIKNSILTYAREYILRMGSNRFVACTYTAEELEAVMDYNSENNIVDNSPASPLLPGDSGNDYKLGKVLKGYDNLTAEQQAAYDEKYIMTYVTVENTVFEEAGIFAIALESHFSGSYLQGGSTYGNDLGVTGFAHWHDLAKTSYGAKLVFEGDVRLYNWKNLKDIDSSVLIENSFTENYDKFADKGFDISTFKFDMVALIQVVRDKTGYRNIIDTIDGEEYVHNGIIIYGGGKNYSIFQNKVNSVEFNHAFQHYPVSFGDVGQQLLTLAAGSEEFAFFIYDSNGTFKYNDQKNLKNKYDCVYN